MPFQPGNKLAAGPRPRPFRDALRVEIQAAGQDQQALRRIARKLLEMAYEGDMQAIVELANRIDGKVPQPIAGADDENPLTLIHRIESVIVSPGDSLNASVRNAWRDEQIAVLPVPLDAAE